jgi:sialate O-acetylesterase
VQLSSIDRPTWPSFREMQNKLQKEIPNSKMAISMDYGDSINVHPIKKKQIAERLALLALHNTYEKPVIANGPSPLKATQKGNIITVSFTNTKQLATANKNEVIGFELVTEKGIRIESKATISKDQILINCPKNEKIKTILYAWKPYTTANLVNEANLPCSTFKLDIETQITQITTK